MMTFWNYTETFIFYPSYTYNLCVYKTWGPQLTSDHSPDIQKKSFPLIDWFITRDTHSGVRVKSSGKKPWTETSIQTPRSNWVFCAVTLYKKKLETLFYIEGWHWTQWPCLWWAWMWALDRASVSLSLALLRLQAWAIQEQVVQSIGLWISRVLFFLGMSSRVFDPRLKGFQ